MPIPHAKFLVVAITLGVSACGQTASDPAGSAQLAAKTDGKASREDSRRYDSHDPQPGPPKQESKPEADRAASRNTDRSDDPAPSGLPNSDAITEAAASAAPDVSTSGSLAAPPILKPGTRLILKFPELPQTLYAMQSGRESTPQAYVALPENYSADRKFPLFVFLYGGHGGEGAGPGRGQEIMENRDCIFVNLPLFKKHIDPNGPFRGMLISVEQDGELICKTYTAMLKRIYDTIPNIDTGHNVIGGMSNGAHSIVAMFEANDAYLMGLFQNLILVEGGLHSIKSYARYQSKAILYLHGDYAGQDDWLGAKMRAELPQFIQKFSEAAASNHLQATELVMPNTGHDMPARFNPEVKRWVVGQLAR